jgi:hypothetical protein
VGASTVECIFVRKGVEQIGPDCFLIKLVKLKTRRVRSLSLPAFYTWRLNWSTQLFDVIPGEVFDRDS